MRLLKKEQTYKNIIYFILAENMKVNDRIPTERELCEKFDVSRITLRDAVDKLVREGILIRNGRNGTLVKSLPSRMSGDGVAQKQILFVYFSSQHGGFMDKVGTAPEQLYLGIEKYVNEKGDVVMVQSGENFIKTDASVLKNVNGIIIGGNADEGILQKIVSRKIPSVLVDCPLSILDIDVVFEDQFEAGYLACKKITKANKAKNILFLGALFDDDERLQSGYREQLRGVEEYIYRNNGLRLVKYNVPVAQFGDSINLEDVAEKLHETIKTNNIEGMVVCSNLLEDLILFYEEQYGEISAQKVAACVITAETLKKVDTPIKAVFLNLRKVGYLSVEYLYQRINNPFKQKLRITVPVSE